MRKLILIVVVLLGALFVVGDFAVKRFAERRAAAAAQSSLSLDDRPTVRFGGFPFIVNLIRGEMPSVTVSVEDIREGDVVVSEAEVTFEDVTFSLGQLLSGEHRRVDVRSAAGRAVITERDLNEALAARGVDASVELEGGRAAVESEDAGTAPADLSLEGRRLVIAPDAPVEPFILRLPSVAPGTTYESVTIEDDEAILGLAIEDVTLEF
jgi:LmeA-like phospholipid-binding